MHEREAGADLRVPERAHHLPGLPRQVGASPAPAKVPFLQGRNARSADAKCRHRENDRQVR